ncbi:MAG: hypothetical protein ACOVMP_04775 [Chthoniobacterales bacterium]
MNASAVHANVPVSKRWIALIFLILFAPSLFLLSTTPPLWRDTDAWHQITSPPNVSTLVHFGPAYCFGARGPMWIGTVIGAAWGMNDWPKSNFFRKPVVSDASVTGLLLVHHFLLAGALTLLVFAASDRIWVRLGLCGLCVIQTPLYIYAHCVGTEAFTMTLIIAMTASLRWIGERERIRPWLWVGYTGLLLVAILTRHPNAVMAAALPGVFLLGAIIDGFRGRDWSAWKRWMRPFVLATAAGLLTILAAKGASHFFCWSGGQTPRSTAGYTLQWKLGYMSGMEPEERRAYWQQVLGPNASEEFPDEILGINVDRVKENGAWQTRTYYWQIIDAIAKRSPEMSKPDAVAEAEIALNSLVMPFLLRGGTQYWNSVWEDFWEGLLWTPADISGQLITTTAKL